MRQAGGVDDVHGNAFERNLLAHGVAGGAGNVGYDGDVVARQGVEQARFAGSLPDAVGHELHVKPSQTTDKSGLMGPVNLHSSGQDNTSYVEALRENPAYEKSNPLPVLNTVKNLPEAAFEAAFTH